MEILSVVKPTYQNGVEKNVLLRIGDADAGIATYSNAVTNIYKQSVLKQHDLHCLFMDQSELPDDEHFSPRPFMVVLDGQLQAVGSKVTPDMMIEEAVPAVHVTQLVYDTQVEVPVSGLRKNDRGSCKHYERCLSDATRKNKVNVCPPTCSTFYPETVLMQSSRTNMED